LREFGALAANLPTSQVSLRFAFDEVGTICVDEAEFQAAFLNLVGNARDAMPSGGEIVVATSLVSLGTADLIDTEARPGAYVQIAVTDHGVGMDAEVQSRIFEPFFTTKPHGVGTGLGMSQVYGFVRSAQGQLVVESAVGRGTTIRINLPRSETLHIERQQAPQTQEQAHPPGASILLVEDDGDVLVATKDRVEELGYLVVTATSGDEAFELLSKGLEVDIVFSDIVMPGKLNGVQLAEAIRRIRPGLKLVLTSGYTGGALDQFHLPKGLLFLPKPYSQKDLAAKLVAARAS
jgi:CheY-like chemotaxis protein